MFLRRAAGLLTKTRFAPRTVGSRTKPTIPLSVPFSLNVESIHKYGVGFSSWMKNQNREDLALWIILSGPAAVFLGINGNLIMADDASVGELGSGYDTGEAYVTDLRRIEDGSVISNSHTSKWRIFTDTGRDLFLKGKLDEAEKYFLSAIREAKEGFGERDPHVAASYNNLAELYRIRKEFEKAEPLYLEAIKILEESFGPEDIRVGAALHNLGQFYLVQKKLEEARICYERALKIKGRVLGYGHTDYADTMYHLGTVLHLQGKEKDAEALIRDSIRILEEGGLGESMTCIKRLRYLSQILLNSNKLLEAENIQRKVLHALELSKGWESLDTVIAAESLALTLQSVGNLRESQELLERCLDVRKKILHEHHVQVAANMLHLARLAMLKSSRLRKADISEASPELDKAKLLLDNSISLESFLFPHLLSSLVKKTNPEISFTKHMHIQCICAIVDPELILSDCELSRNMKIAQVIIQLTFARIAKLNLDSTKGSKSNMHNSGAKENSKDEHAALVILLQSLDALGLVEITKLELQQPTEGHVPPPEAVHALEQCISIVREPGIHSFLLNSPEVNKEYLSCLKHLVSLLIGSSIDKESSVKMRELKDEIRRLEEELSPKRKRRS